MTNTDTSQIIPWLERQIKHSTGNIETERLVLKFGRAFKPTLRPSEIPLGNPKHCFENAMNLVDLNRINYVEGFACIEGDYPFRHAWISTDGEHAIEVTIDEPEKTIFYFGVMFPFELWLKLAGSTEYSFLSPPIDGRVEPGLLKAAE